MREDIDLNSIVIEISISSFLVKKVIKKALQQNAKGLEMGRLPEL